MTFHKNKDDPESGTVYISEKGILLWITFAQALFLEFTKIPVFINNLIVVYFFDFSYFQTKID